MSIKGKKPKNGVIEEDFIDDEAPAKKGHNNPPKVGGVAVDQLKSIIARVENLEEEKSGITADIRDVYSEAKGNGFDIKAIRAIVTLRKKDPAQAEEEETIYDTYRRALGLIPEIDDVV